MIDDHRTIPGGPRKSLVAKVRQALNRYGIRPYAPHTDLNQIWRDAWTWAAECNSKSACLLTSERLRRRIEWPQPNEIASQYVFLLLAKMRNDIVLRLPWQARIKGMPAAISAAYEAPDFLKKSMALTAKRDAKARKELAAQPPLMIE